MGGWTRLWFAVSAVWVLFVGGLALMETTFPLAAWFVMFVPPLMLYSTGLTVRWILRGFLGELPARRSA